MCPPFHCAAPAPSFEHLVLNLSGHTQFVIAVVYCPPKPHPSFLSDFSDFLTQFCSFSLLVLLLSDFNIHIHSTDFTTTKAKMHNHLP